MSTVLLGTGSYLPERVINNEDLTQFPSAGLPLIAQKTGIRSRRHAAEGEATSDLGAAAALACLERAGCPAEEVDAIIVATSSPDRIHPPTATRVQHLIGARSAFALDVNAVCAGAVFGLHLADGMICSGRARRVLLVAAEVYSRFLNPKDFSSYPYFGDGAGAVLLGPGEEGRGVLRCILHTDGSGADVIQVPAGGSMQPVPQDPTGKDRCFTMRGREVYDFAVEKGSSVLRELLREQRVDPDHLSAVISHQANINIIQEISRRSEVAIDRFVVNLDRYGNTAGASVLIGLDEWHRAEADPRGRLVALVAFGGGLSWGASLIRL